MIDIIFKWQDILGISDWDITTERIDPKQVAYEKGCPVEDQYFIGILRSIDSKRGVIYHDKDLYEEAIIHELLHVKYPDESEEWISNETAKRYNS